MLNIRLLLASALALALAGCGGSSNPAGPSGGSGGSGGGPSSNKTVTVTIDGVAFAPTNVTAARSNPGFEIVTVVASNTSGSSGTTVSFAAPTQVGVYDVSAVVTQRGTGNLTIVSGGTGVGYLAFATTGSGSVTITSISATAVAGRVDLVMAPTSGAGPNKTVSGTFNVAF